MLYVNVYINIMFEYKLKCLLFFQEQSIEKQELVTLDRDDIYERRDEGILSSLKYEYTLATMELYQT